MQNDEWGTIDEQFKNKSSWTDSIFGRVKTDKFDAYYENVQTKISSKTIRHKKTYKFLTKLYRLYYNIFGPFHILPDLLILGAGACGTTSLMELYLRSNEHIIPSKNNEILFFDYNFFKSINWYKVFFPNKFQKFFRTLLGKKTLTCEASGSYFFHPHAPKRIKKIVPNIKIVVMLREPAERAFSQYRRQVRNGRQKLSFEEAIEIELKTYDKKFEELEKNEDLNENIFRTAYIARSRYVESIERWMKLFPKNQFLFINSNEYFKNPLNEYNKVLDFLGLPNHHPTVRGKRGISPPNLYKSVVIKPETKNFLQNYFVPWNEKLFQLIGKRYEWS